MRVLLQVFASTDMMIQMMIVRTDCMISFHNVGLALIQKFILETSCLYANMNNNETVS